MSESSPPAGKTGIRSLESLSRFLAVQREAARPRADLGLLLRALADPEPAVVRAAKDALAAVAPLAALPVRREPAAPRATDPGAAPVPAWILESCAGWDTENGFPAAAARVLRALDPSRQDEFLFHLAHFLGARADLARVLERDGAAGLAARFAAQCAAYDQVQFVAQVTICPTMSCQLACPYCIAHAPSAGSSRDATLPELEAFLDWAARSGYRRIALSGGEPTTYRDFGALLRAITDRGLEFFFATNGLFDAPARDAIIAARPLSVSLHFAPEVRGPRLAGFAENARAFLAAGLAVSLRYNLLSPAARHEESLRLAAEIGIPDVRVAVPMPNLQQENRYVLAEGFAAFAPGLAALAREAARLGITLRLAKPFPLCLLEEEAARAFLAGGSPAINCLVHLNEFTNNMIVYPDFSYAPCLGFNRRVTAPVTDHADARAAARVYADEVREAMAADLFPHCGACPLSAGGRCVGACLSYRRLERPAG
jgi:sugar phosphate isomerase/epimerase